MIQRSHPCEHCKQEVGVFVVFCTENKTGHMFHLNPNDKPAGVVMLCPDGPEQPTITGRKAVEVNQREELTCSAASVPPANYTWKLNNTATATTAAVFIIASATYKDTGTYTCEARNIITGKTTSTSHTLSVRGELRHAAQTDH